MSTTAGARTLRIGTRGSALALVQSRMVAAAITAHAPDVSVELVRITTKGDTVLDRPLAQIGGKGLFVTEIEDAMRDGRVDLAVHSAKDLPSELPDDMMLAAIPRREDPRDVLVGPAGGIAALPARARVGTSSPRRQSQLRALRNDLELLDVRGNVDTRLRKLDAGEYDALVLAAAGLNRLGVRDPRIQPLDVELMLPAVGQGALAIETRRDDATVAALLEALLDADAADAVAAERAFLQTVGGGCDSAVAAHAVASGDAIVVHGMIGDTDGRVVRDSRRGARGDGSALARELARALLAQGGAALVPRSR